MKTSSPYRIPLTVVGIVFNVMALTVVSLLLYSEPQSKHTALQKLADTIREMAKSRQVLPKDLIGTLGNPKLANTVGDYWVGFWQVSSTDYLNDNDLAYIIRLNSLILDGVEGEPIYTIKLTVVQTWRGGVKYLGKNLARALQGEKLFPFKPYYEEESMTLQLRVADY